ncbi:MAG TPA: helix-turn-helix domain-containing protein [Acidimicrobiales bacterium]|jgi:AcrR family transcriptional regulator|nr:helix-turn-helix domain-containing protein [Acidimicrobiales bacterium]
MTATDSPTVRRDAARNRARLLEAAGRVFADHGLDAGVDEVARSAGLGMGTLYRHFPTKETLIGALVEEIVDRMVAVAESALAVGDGTGLEQFLEASGAVQAAHRGCLPRLWSMTGRNEKQIHLRRCVNRLLTDAKRHELVRRDLAETDVTLIMWSLRGVIETTGAVSPDAWRRHLSLLVAAIRPGGPPLARSPITRAECDRIIYGDAGRGRPGSGPG